VVGVPRKFCPDCNCDLTFLSKEKKEKVRGRCRECYLNKRKIDKLKNRDANLEKRRIWHKNNRDRVIAVRKKSYIKNKEKIKAKKRESVKLKKQNDPAFKVRINLSKSVLKKLKLRNSDKNNESCLKYLGYTQADFVKHIESLFEPWMNWNNWGVYKMSEWIDDDPSTWKWHIDHIIPDCSFNYLSMKDEDFKKSWALENLRPLSAKENMSKGYKL
jgi:hypothetical protein